MKHLLTLFLILLASVASAQSARVIQLPSGKYVGFFSLPGGNVVYLDDVEVVKLPKPVAPISQASVVAFVFDNDAPDIRLQSQMQLAIRELRKSFDSVVQIDDSPQSVGSIKQGPVIVAEANRVGLPAIVIVDSSDPPRVIQATKMPKTGAEINFRSNGLAMVQTFTGSGILRL